MAEFIIGLLSDLFFWQVVGSLLFLAAVLFRYFRKRRDGTLNYSDWDQGDTTNYPGNDNKGGE